MDYMKRLKDGATFRQTQYARRILSGQGKNKKEIALSVGYAPSVASSVMSKIESTEGYANAVRSLADETGDIVMLAYASLKKRNLDNESTETILKSINILANAWQVFSNDKKQDQEPNRLRLALNQTIKSQTVNIIPANTEPKNPE